MKKRIISIVLSVIMLICIMPISSALADDPISVIVSADKTSVYRGDTVVFTVSIGAVEHLMGAEFKVDVPMGMTYIAGSATVADGLKETLGCQAADWTESTKKFTMYGEGDYSSNSPTKFLTFSCTVDMTATGSLVPDVYNVVVSNTSYEELLTNVNKEAATVTIALPATNIKLNKTELALASGADETLIATVVPNNSTDKVSWESDNSDVASVDKSGKVTAHKVGKAVITATAGEATDTCTVTVTCGHKLKANHPAVESTCTAQGHDAYIQCDECGQLFDEKNNEIEEIPSRPLADHKGGTATCKDKAVCSVCNQPYGDYADHNYGDLINEVPADHNNEGMKAHYKCSVCGKFFTESKEETTEEALKIPKVAHEYGDWQSDESNHWKECGCGNKVDVAAHSGGKATCTKKAKCAVCGREYGKTDPNNHNYEDKVVPPTCTEKGYTVHTCKDCGNEVKDTYTEALGHSGGEATCVAKAKCAVCGVEYGSINPKNHKHTEIRDAEEPTCTKEGFTGDTWCTDCKNKIVDGTVILKTPHNYNDKVVAPTCTEKGYTIHTCKDCADKLIDTYTDALGHKVVEWTVTKEATAEESGTKTGKCTVCGEEITAETGKLISKVEGDSAKVEAVGDTTLYENIILKTDKMGDKLSDTDKADMQAKIEALKLAVENIKMAEIFDISLFLRDTDASGNPIQDLKYEPNGKIRITMEVPEAIFKNFKNVKLLHFLDDGTVETVDYILDGSKAVFDTESLSYFAFAGTPVVTDTGTTNDNGTKNENNGQSSSPKTGDRSNPIVWIAVLLVSALTVGTVSVYNRKKNCRAFKK